MVNTEILLYRRNIIEDPNFKETNVWLIDNDASPLYGWTQDGSGRARFETGVPTPVSIYQQDVMRVGVEYRIRMYIENFDVNALTIYCGTTAYNSGTLTDGWLDVTLLCQGNGDFRIDCFQTLTIHIDYSYISHVSVVEYPCVVNLDATESISIPLTFNVADIREPEKRNANFSKTVTIPGTKNNNKIFHEIFEIGVDGLFNPNKRTDAVILQDSIEIFKGVIKLNKINRMDYPQGEITYDVVFLGKVANLFLDIGANKLTDLDFSEYNHTFNKGNQKLSWDTSIMKNGSYHYNFTSGNPDGSGYVYPYIDYGTAVNVNTWNVNDFRPAIYVKEYVDKIFKAAGFTYESNFFNSNFFKRLIIPNSAEKMAITASQINERSFRASMDSTIDYTATSFLYDGYNSMVIKVPFNNDFSGVNFDPGNCYNPSTYEFTVPADGVYTFQTDQYFNIHAENPNPVTISWQTNPMFRVRIKKRVGSSITTIASTTYVYNTCAYGSNLTVVNPFDTQDSGQILVIAQAAGITLHAGDVIYCEVEWSQQNIFEGTFYSNGTGFFIYNDHGGYACSYSGRDPMEPLNEVNLEDATVTLQIKSGTTVYNKVANSQIMDGLTMTLNSVVPETVTQKDFLIGLINMFNLYIETDKDDDKKLLIEPRDDYYNSGIVRDWTQKLDVSQKLELAPMSELQGRNYLYTYKTDSDAINKKYNDNWKEVYGQQLKTVDNDFVTNTNKTEITFSPTPLELQPATDRVISRIYKFDAATGNTTQTKSNIRILYYGGLKSTGHTWSYTSSVSGTSSEVQYPYAGHLDDVNNPSVDLCFGFPKELYWNALSYTPNNLYNMYYRRFLEEITDKDSKLVTGYFHLKPMDIFHLDFRNLFLVDGHYLRLNKISDFNINDTKPVQCEFIKVRVKDSWTPKTIFRSDVGPVMYEGFLTPTVSSVTPMTGGNVVMSTTSVVKGEGNYLAESVKSSIVTGNNNKVFEGSSNISILGGNNNVIDSGVSNVTIINTDDLYITESNVTYVNGIKIYNNGSMVVPVNVIDAGIDCVLSTESSAKMIDVIDGSQDVTRRRGSRSQETNIEGREL